MQTFQFCLLGKKRCSEIKCGGGGGVTVSVFIFLPDTPGQMTIFLLFTARARPRYLYLSPVSPPRLLHLDDEVLDDADIVTDLMVLNPPRSSSEFPPPPIPRPDIVSLRIKYPRNYNILLSIMHSYIPH